MKQFIVADNYGAYFLQILINYRQNQCDIKRLDSNSKGIFFKYCFKSFIEIVYRFLKVPVTSPSEFS